MSSSQWTEVFFSISNVTGKKLLTNTRGKILKGNEIISDSETISRSLAEHCAPRATEAGFKSKGIYPSSQTSYEKLPSLQSVAESPLCGSVSRSQETRLVRSSMEMSETHEEAELACSTLIGRHVREIMASPKN
jgi:hypothetical protein